MKHRIWLLEQAIKSIFVACYFIMDSINLVASTPPNPCITIVIADWGMQEALHNELETSVPPSYTLALHFLGKKAVATGQHNLLIQIPTTQECLQAKTYHDTLPDHVRKRVQGVFIEANDGVSNYPKAPVGSYLVLSQPPLNPNPMPSNKDTVMGHFWGPPSLSLEERQKIYNMTLDYAKKAGHCLLTITVNTRDVWEHFQKWVSSVQGVQWVTLAEHLNACQKAPDARKP